jgi:hypothetical protein
MFNLSGPFEGIGVNLGERDLAGAKASYQAFQAQYTKMSKMVPEWTSRFPQAPVMALGRAIEGGNPAQIGPAMGGVGQVCGDCHLLFQVKTQQKYHWKNFDDIRVVDPASQKKLNFVDYMTAMAGSFGGITVDLQANKADRAIENFQTFSSRFSTLATDACVQCHVDQAGNEIPRRYYVDSDSLALVEQMGQALSASPPDVPAVMNLSGAIGNGICLSCHLVHFPAQVAKDTWSSFKAVLK